MTIRIMASAIHDSTDYEKLNFLISNILSSKHLVEIIESKLTINSLMQIRYEATKILSNHFRSRRLEKLLLVNNQHRNASTLLHLLGHTKLSYCLNSGMSRKTFYKMEKGQLTVRNLLESQPEVALYPLVRETTNCLH